MKQYLVKAKREGCVRASCGWVVRPTRGRCALWGFVIYVSACGVWKSIQCTVCVCPWPRCALGGSKHLGVGVGGGRGRGRARACAAGVFLARTRDGRYSGICMYDEEGVKFVCLILEGGGTVYTV